MTGKRGSRWHAGHGTPARWRGNSTRPGCRCPECAQAHLDDQAAYKHRTAMRWWETRGPDLCALLAAGRPYREALDEMETTAQAVTAHRRRDPAFAARLDAALHDGRDPTLDHGTATAWRRGCRCPDCRTEHERHRTTKRSTP